MKTKIQVTAIFTALLFISTFLASAEYYRTTRAGEVPAYRYYDKLSPLYQDSSYKPEDINIYWGERYYGNTDTDARESLRMEMEIMNLEQRDLHASETLAKSS
jgi:hypothetical protein